MRLAMATAAALLLACAGSRAPVARPLADADPRPAALLEAQLREGAARTALRGVAKLAIDGPNGSGRARQIVLVERPAKLRVEVLGLLDQTLALLVTDGAHYRFVRGADRFVERDAVHEALLEEVAGLAVAPARGVRLLLASPVGPGTRLLGGASLDDGGVRVLVAPAAGLEREALDFDADARLRRWALLGADGDPLLEARFDDWRAAGASDFPFAVEIDDRVNETRVRVEWSRVELNPVLSPALFDPGEAP